MFLCSAGKRRFFVPAMRLAIALARSGGQHWPRRATGEAGAVLTAASTARCLARKPGD
jgi:hypothetical protein